MRIDDILVGGKGMASMLSNLRNVFQVLKECGLRLKKDKCVFMKDSVVYLGMRIDKNGTSPVKEKISAVLEAPPPRNVHELKSFLGMLTYYHKHLPNVANLLEPLHRLLRTGQKWMWGTEENETFGKAKALLTSAHLLVHYDPEKPLILACDASPYGVGAVLSHLVEGIEKPIAYASKTLNAAERNYSQVEKEGLAIMFGIKKFHQYCYGRPFTIISDHKPLEGLLGENKPISGTSVARMQRWAIILSSYDYKFVYREGEKHQNADALSRLPLNTNNGDNIDPGSFPFENIRLLELDSSPVTAVEVRKSSRKDSMLKEVANSIHTGSWGETREKASILPFYVRRNEMSVDEGCVLWGNRVVIPRELRPAILKELHQCHPGISRMKALARSYVWWPGMDQDIVLAVNKCQPCQENQSNVHRAPIHPWEWTNKPWVRLHIDHAGPYLNKYFLIVVDSYSKWLDVIPTKADTKDTVKILRKIFATHGLPERIVSDNGSPFTSGEFESFLQRNEIKQIRTSTYHASSNGMAERYVQTFKHTMNKMPTEKDIDEELQKFLFAYRITPQTTTGKTPAELLMGRRLISALDLLRPNLDRQIREKMSSVVDRPKTNRIDLQLLDPVYVRNFGQGSLWWKGKIVNRHGPVTWLIELTDGRVIQRHVDHVRLRNSEVDVDAEIDKTKDQLPINEGDITVTNANDRNESDSNNAAPAEVTIDNDSSGEGSSQISIPASDANMGNNTGTLLRRSTRIRNAPERYGNVSND